jgi:hypothetical protein
MVLKDNIATERKLYREIFTKAQEEFFALADNLKEKFSCENCQSCHKMIYVNKTPSEIIDRIEENNEKQALWKKFKDYFVPYGYEIEENWAEINFDPQANHIAAARVSKEYVAKVLAFNEKAFFYKFSPPEGSIETMSEVFPDYPFKLLTLLHANCIYNDWQDLLDTYIKEQLSVDINKQIKKIHKYRENFHCKLSGTCCRLASSQYSFDELKKKATLGDDFAAQFTRVFTPYETIEAARELFPEYVDFVLTEFSENENIHFYYCTKVTEDNLCSIYHSIERPKICQDFPNNPLTILYPVCGFYQWKQEIKSTALLCHAMIEICNYSLEKMEEIRMIRNSSL